MGDIAATNTDLTQELRLKGRDFKEIVDATLLPAFDAEIAAEVCRRLVAGRTLEQVCKDPGLPSYAAVLKWATDVAEFRQVLDHFEECALEVIGQGLVQMADATFGSEKTLIDANKLRIQTRQWMLERRHRKRYGAQLDVNHSGSIGIKASFHFDLGGAVQKGRVIDMQATAYRTELEDPALNGTDTVDEEDIFS